MKKVFILFLSVLLVSCGTMGIGSNHNVNIHNDSDDFIIATGTSGSVKIAPNTAREIESFDNITLKSNDENCDVLVVSRRANTAAIVLDVFPGFFIGIIPILIDAVSNNLYKMPSNYYYQCN